MAKEMARIMTLVTQPIPAMLGLLGIPYTERRSAISCVPKITRINTNEGRLFHQNPVVRVEKITK